MDPQTIIAIATLVTSAGAFLTAVAAAIVSLRNNRKIEEVRHATNSLTDRLVETTAKSSKALGEKEEKERQEKERQGSVMSPHNMG